MERAPAAEASKAWEGGGEERGGGLMTCDRGRVVGSAVRGASEHLAQHDAQVFGREAALSGAGQQLGELDEARVERGALRRDEKG